MQRVEALRPLFPRNSYLIINDKVINDENNNGLRFEVEIKSGSDQKIGVARILIYNLSQDVLPGSEVKINFGYADDVGEYGTYEVVKFNKYREGGDIIKELLCSERSKNTSKIISLSIDGNVRISEAITQVCEKAGINIISMELLKDKIFTNGYTCYNKAFNEIKDLVSDAESKFVLKSNDLYIYHKDLKEKVINLTFESGLIENVKNNAKLESEKTVDTLADNKEGNNEWSTNNTKSSKASDYEVICFPIHYIKKGDIVNVECDTFSGFVQVREIAVELKEKWVMKLKVAEYE